jgi:hemin uptake protein HemP
MSEQPIPAPDSRNGNAAEPGPSSRADAVTTYESEALLHGQREVLIRHGDETYRLRLTKQGKLILYK